MKPIALDLGLSVRWADRNLGAETPDKLGTNFFHNRDLTGGAEETKFFNNLIKNEIGKKWRLPTIEEVLELEKCSWQVVSHRVSRDGYAWYEGANKVVSYNKTCLYLHSSILVGGLAFFSFKGKNDNPGIFITYPDRQYPYNPDGIHYYYGFYQYNIRYGEDAKRPPTTSVYIRPVTDELPTLSDRLRKFSEEDIFKNYKLSPQKPIPISIERINDFSESQYRQYQDEQRREKEWQDQYWAMKREEDEKRKVEEEQKNRIQRQEQIARINRNRPRNKYDTGSIVVKTEMPGTRPIVDLGWIKLINKHEYSFKHEINSWTGDDEGWHGRLECSYYNWTSRWTETFHELVQEIENFDFERCQNFYDLHGRLPEFSDW